MRQPQSVVHSAAEAEVFINERVENIACGTSKWNLKGVTVRPVEYVWSSVVKKRARHED